MTHPKILRANLWYFLYVTRDAYNAAADHSVLVRVMTDAIDGVVISSPRSECNDAFPDSVVCTRGTIIRSNSEAGTEEHTRQESPTRRTFTETIFVLGRTSHKKIGGEA